VSEEIHRGLKGVVFDRSRVCFIDGRAGELRYRGYSIHDLAQSSTFEETCYLLLNGELPGRDPLKAFDAELKAARKLPSEIHKLIELTKSAHPMEVLRTAASALGAFDPDVADNSPAAIIRKGIRLTSQVPMIVAAHEHIRNGRAPVAPDPKLGHAANFLYMLKGKAPGADTARHRLGGLQLAGRQAGRHGGDADRALPKFVVRDLQHQSRVNSTGIGDHDAPQIPDHRSQAGQFFFQLPTISGDNRVERDEQGGGGVSGSHSDRAGIHRFSFS